SETESGTANVLVQDGATVPAVAGSTGIFVLDEAALSAWEDHCAVRTTRALAPATGVAVTTWRLASWVPAVLRPATNATSGGTMPAPNAAENRGKLKFVPPARQVTVAVPLVQA